MIPGAIRLCTFSLMALFAITAGVISQLRHHQNKIGLLTAIAIADVVEYHVTINYFHAVSTNMTYDVIIP